MLRFSDIVFGPIKSRRLGSSLGVNLLPAEGKLCNFDCIYCECGWNKDGLEGSRQLPDAVSVRSALEDKLGRCLETGQPIDSITFSGNGEPTLNPFFPEIIDVVIELRDKLFPMAKVSVLSNASMLSRPGIIDALKKTDNPILKVDGGNDSFIRLMNRPAFPYSLDSVIENLMAFDGNFVLQTMFLKGKDLDDMMPESLSAWENVVRKTHPREIMVYTLDREAPLSGLSKYSVEEMRVMVEPLLKEGYKVQIRG